MVVFMALLTVMGILVAKAIHHKLSPGPDLIVTGSVPSVPCRKALAPPREATVKKSLTVQQEGNRKIDILNSERSVPIVPVPSPPQKNLGLMMNFAVNGFASENPGKIPCRINHLTDIVVYEKVTRIVLSDPSDFKIEIVKGKSRQHLVVMPLKKSASSDLFVFGVNRVHYLRMKTVPKGKRYVTRVEIGGPYYALPAERN